MWKYAAVAAAARAFSINDTTKVAYRRLGNAVLSRMRVADGLPDRYVDRAKRLVRTCDAHRILRPGDRVLELGTGWVHWEATVLRLFYDVEVTLFDVCDNRLFSALQCYLEQLDGRLDEIGEELGLTPERTGRARARLAAARAVASFDELYELMHFTYVVDPGGMLDGLPESEFSLVVSADVLEHVDGATLPAYLRQAQARLEPGGYSLHQIDLVDHFHYFDPSCSPKHFYRYDETTWRRLWNSDVQYVNRIQRHEWLRLFEGAGLVLEQEDLISEPMGGVPRAPDFRDLSDEDVDCLQMVPLHRRPEAVVPRQRTGTDRGGQAPAVSVCIPVHNGGHYLRDAITSVLEQSRPDVELVIRDNGSTDGTAEIVRSFTDPRIRVEHVATTVPVTENWNAAVRLCRAPLVKLLCADDLLSPRSLEVQAAAMEVHPDLALVAGRTDLIDTDGRVITANRMLRGLTGRIDSNDAVRTIVRHGGNPIGPAASVLFRRSQFDAVGGFDGTSVLTSDIDLWARLLELGPLLGLRETVAEFRIHPQSLSGAVGRQDFRRQRAFTTSLADSGAWEINKLDLAAGAVGARAARARRQVLFAAGGLISRRHPSVRSAAFPALR